MRFDVLEEHFDIPALLVKSGNRLCCPRLLVGQKNQFLACFRIFVRNPAQVFGVRIGALGACEADILVRQKTLFGLYNIVLCHFIGHLVLCPGDEQEAAAVQIVKLGKVQVDTVAYNHASSWETQRFSHCNVMLLEI